MARLRAGEAQPEVGENARVGRLRSLAVSLSYGFANAFIDIERDRLALLYLFRDTVDVNVLRFMGDERAVGEDAVPELGGLDRAAWLGLLDRAADIGLLAPMGSEHYTIHPALSWYFTALFTAAYGEPADLAARRSTRAYATAIGALGNYYHNQAEDGRANQVVAVLRAEEGNLRHALNHARANQLWDAAKQAAVKA